MPQSLTSSSCCNNIHQAWEDTPQHGTEARGDFNSIIASILES